MEAAHLKDGPTVPSGGAGDYGGAAVPLGKAAYRRNHPFCRIRLHTRDGERTNVRHMREMGPVVAFVSCNH